MFVPFASCVLAWIIAMIQKTKDYGSSKNKSVNRNSLENELAI